MRRTLLVDIDDTLDDWIGHATIRVLALTSLQPATEVAAALLDGD
jgi:hypothetical protein